MKRFHLLLSLLLVSITSVAENISSIDIKGLNSISRGTVLSYLPFEKGDPISEKQLDLTKTSLLRTNFFKSVKARFQENILIVDVVENPIIKWIEVKNYDDGNVLSSENLDDVLKNNQLKVGSIYIEKNLKKFIESIVNVYKEEGFFKTKITLNSSLDEQNRIGLEIDIQEGERAKIKKFTIKGSSLYTEDDLLENFEIGEPDFILLNYFTEKDSFKKNALDAGIEKISNLYISEGYLDFKFTDTQVNFIDDNSLSISLDLSEGEVFTLGDVKFESPENLLNYEKYNKKFTELKNKNFKRIALLRVISLIEKELKNKGFAYAKITPSLKIKPGSQIVDIELDFFLEEKYVINRINITGNYRTQDEVIRRELSFLEGELYPLSKINESISRLKRLGFFSDVKLAISKSKENQSLIDINIELTETKTGEITFGVSHSSSTGASFNAGIAQNNFLGTGIQLNAALESSNAVKNINLYVKDPHINKEGHAMSYGIFSKTTDAAELDISSYTLDKKGIVLGYGLNLSKNSSVFAETTFSTNEVLCSDSMKINEPTQCGLGSSFLNTVSLKYSKDSRNDYLFPTNGSSFISKLTLATPFSNLNYWKSENSYKKYSPFGENFTFKRTLEINFADGYSGDALPFYERFFSGGASSLRGFSFNAVSPLYSDLTNKGGEFQISSTLAIAKPLDFSNTNEGNVQGILFLDTGTVGESLGDSFDLRASVGAQLTWKSPIGPIGIYYAVPIKKLSTDVTEEFSLNLGASF